MCHGFQFVRAVEIREQGSMVRAWSTENIGFCTLFTSKLDSECRFLNMGTTSI